MPKKKAKTKAGKKVVQKQKQTVIVNVTKRGGGKSKARPSAPRPQQIPQVIFQQPQQQFPQYERPQERPHTNERERSHVDEILNVVQRANNIYRQQPPPQATTTTNVDVGQILTGGAAVLKTGLDIYRNYTRGQQEQQREQQREERRVEVPASNIPARPAIPPRPPRPIPVPPRPIPVPPRPQPARPIPTPPVITPTPRPKPNYTRTEDLIYSLPTPARPTPTPAPSLPAPATATAPARPSFHIKNILGQIEFKGAMSAAKQELKYGQEIRMKANESQSSVRPVKVKGPLGEGERKIGNIENVVTKLEKIGKIKDMMGRINTVAQRNEARQGGLIGDANRLLRENRMLKLEGILERKKTKLLGPPIPSVPSGPQIGGKRKDYHKGFYLD